MHMTQANYQEARQQLLRRAALGEKNIAALLDKLDADHEAAQKASALEAEVAMARADLAFEAGQIALQAQYDEAAATVHEMTNTANDLADAAEKAIATAKEAFVAWQQGIEAARMAAQMAHHMRQQGARGGRMPFHPNAGELTLHLIEKVGQHPYQRILHNGLPRAA
jgi:methyl-accepting chemotaxis protein